jgi:hypothetical protein
MLSVALSNSFRASKRLWHGSNVIEAIAGHAGEQRLHVMRALSLNVLANFGEPLTPKGHVSSPLKALSSRRCSRGVVGAVDPLEFSARALLRFGRSEQCWKESVIWTHCNGYNTF